MVSHVLCFPPVSLFYAVSGFSLRISNKDICAFGKRYLLSARASPLKESFICFLFSAFVLFGSCQYFNIVFHGIYFFSCKMDCLDFAKQTDYLYISEGAECFSLYVQMPVFLGYTVSCRARGEKLKGSGNITAIFAEILYITFTFHAFFLSFWALALWHGQVLGISWHQRQMLCWDSVLLPWWPVPGCLPAWLALLKPELLQISLPAACSQGEPNSAFMFSLVADSLLLDSVLKVFPSLNDTTGPWHSVKVVRKFQRVHFCSVRGSTTASLCGLRKAIWFRFCSPILFYFFVCIL